MFMIGITSSTTAFSLKTILITLSLFLLLNINTTTTMSHAASTKKTFAAFFNLPKFAVVGASVDREKVQSLIPYP